MRAKQMQFDFCDKSVEENKTAEKYDLISHWGEIQLLDQKRFKQ